MKYLNNRWGSIPLSVIQSEIKNDNKNNIDTTTYNVC